MRVCQFRHIRISSDLYIITIIADYCKRLFANSFLFIIYIWVRHKPGSVSDNHLSWPTVTDRLMRPTSRTATGRRFLCPAWSCSEWGLHGKYVTIFSCELLPHNFNLTTALPVSAECFCCTFPIVTYAGRYPASCPAEPGLSSSRYTRDATACSTQLKSKTCKL